MSTNHAELRAMVHFITRHYAMEPQRLGSVKLHKILWFTEIQAIRKFGKSIAHEKFIKMPFGPFVTDLAAVVAELESDGLLHVRKSEDDFEPDLFVGKGEPDHRALTEEQWRVLEQAMNRVVDDHSATSISEKSHGPIWESVDLYDEMPVGAAALVWLTPTDEDRKAVSERLGH